MKFKSIIDGIRLLARYAAFVTLGAAFYAYYLDETMTLASPEIGQFWRRMTFVGIGLNLIGSRWPSEMMPDVELIATVGMIGLFSAGFLALNYQTTADLLIGGAIIICGMGFVYLLGRSELLNLSSQRKTK